MIFLLTVSEKIGKMSKTQNPVRKLGKNSSKNKWKSEKFVEKLSVNVEIVNSDDLAIVHCKKYW